MNNLKCCTPRIRRFFFITEFSEQTNLWPSYLWTKPLTKMKALLSLLSVLFTGAFCISQPNMTLWITPDGYHTNHDHSNMQEYFCNSNYYIFYHHEQDSLFITVKNDGTETLILNSINTQEFIGSNFEVVGFTAQNLAPGELYTIKLPYQLPSEYFNGINGSISFQSNDPDNTDCSLHFDVGCFVEWNFRANPFAGVNGTCSAPIVWSEESNNIGNPSMMFDDSMTFFAYNSSPDTAFKIMKIIEQGVIMQKDVLAMIAFLPVLREMPQRMPLMLTHSVSMSTNT